MPITIPKLFGTSRKNVVLRSSIVLLLIFLPLRELLEYHFGSNVKLIADMLVVLAAVLTIATYGLRIRVTKIDITVLLLFIASTLSIVVNQVPWSSAALQLRGIFIFYVIYFVIRNAQIDKVDFKLLAAVTAKVVTLMVTASVIFAFIEVLTNKTLLFPVAWATEISINNISRSYSFLNNPNIFAGFLILGSVLIKYCSTITEKTVSRYFYIVPATGIILSQSRSGLLAGLIVLFIIFLPQIKKVIRIPILQRIIPVLGVIILATGLSAVAALKSVDTQYGENRFLDAINGNESEYSQVDGRLYIIDTIADTYEKHGNYLLGLGPGTLNNQSEDYNQYGLPPGFTSDNQYLKFYAETGIVGASLLLVIILSMAYKYRKNTYALAAIFALMFFSFFYNAFEIQVIAFFFWLILAYVDKDMQLDLTAIKTTPTKMRQKRKTTQ